MAEKIIAKIVKKLAFSAGTPGVDFQSVLRKASGENKVSLPTKSELTKVYHKLLKNKEIKPNKNLDLYLRRKAVRTMSGVAVVSVLTKPFMCPGNCLYCPTEKAMPKSYLSNEPAVMRAIANDFDPFRQVEMRLKALKANNHDISKIEVIVMGGTWSYFDKKYQDWFIKRCFDALNNKPSKNLSDAQKKNETAHSRCVGLTLETRPDYINEEEIKQMRKLGCTRVELGIQHIDDKVLALNKRGHTVEQSYRAIELLRRAGFKLNFHIMPALYGSNVKKDLKVFQDLYTKPEWLPDMIKIYPCVVTINSELYKIWRAGKYKPYTNKQLLDLLTKVKKITPTYVRIARLIRDIPEQSILAGNKITNLRQVLQNNAKRDGWACQCIRCREAGHQPPSLGSYGESKTSSETPVLNVLEMSSLGGTEYFISCDSPNKKVLYAFARLRINNPEVKQFMPELKGAAIIRELHTYGEVAGVGQKGEVQHSGFGRKLMTEAERICREKGIKKLAVIAGIGVRAYYKKLGYKLKGTYMVKELD
ncbi:MAG: tRNA uridine(34) 5-carboxymethylaminomethyl modification radical SAM/GNAT enzyme Elp3 [Minisyncoccia bacterium]